METCVQEAHTKETNICLCLNGESSYIHCFGEGVRIFCGSQLIESPNVEIVTSLDIAPWLNPKLSAVQNTIEVCRRVRKILNPCSYFGISLTLNNLDSLDIPRILAIPHLMPRRRIMVIGSEIDKAQLDLIMEEGPEVRDVLLDVKKIPDNYHHKNAFKFSSFICTDSRWVQIESLLSFRNRMVVALNNNPFTIVDINRLIKQWINGDCDMFAHLVLNYTGPRETGLMDVLFDGLVTLELHRGGTLFYLFIQLSILSKFMETCVQEAHTKETNICLCLNGESSYIYCADEGVGIFCGNQQIENPNAKEIVTSLDIAPWLNPKLSAMENTIEVCERIRKMLNPCKVFDISLDMDKLDPLSMQQVLAVPHLMPRQGIIVRGAEIDTEQLDLIMEEGSDDRDIFLYVKKIPDNYYHENAFKFLSFYYTDSRLMKIESLLSIRNRIYVGLNNCPFTPEDINRLIKQWINGDCDMFEQLELKYTGSKADTKVTFFDGLVTLEMHHGGRFLFLFSIAESSTLRKLKILSLYCTKNWMKFLAIPIKEKYIHPKMPVVIGKVEYQILQMLNSKKKFQDEIVEKRESNPRDPNIFEMEENIREIDGQLIRKGVDLDSKIPILRQF
ncbi:hypothetical protein B9Z55_004768 [Caenorhabditis nigoni]|uniref:Sdz-33 F-box domain-containing protein n=2 Tax=Caenorhabditis nigoni TaxID=1611254 RepID=A0A2G5UY17_9PELO|nr:hypothetical protein B9Z55_004768 [Caenorhabditis nigoni]